MMWALAPEVCLPPSRLKHVGASFVSAILAETIFAAAFAIRGTPGLRREQLFGFLYFSSILVIPGWLIALPILVLPRKAISLPLWQLLLIGTLIGPAIITAIALYTGIASHTGFAYNRVAFNWLYLATAISFVTTAIYLTVLKLLSRNSIQPTA